MTHQSSYVIIFLGNITHLLEDYLQFASGDIQRKKFTLISVLSDVELLNQHLVRVPDLYGPTLQTLICLQPLILYFSRSFDHKITSIS